MYTIVSGSTVIVCKLNNVRYCTLYTVKLQDIYWTKSYMIGCFHTTLYINIKWFWDDHDCETDFIAIMNYMFTCIITHNCYCNNKWQHVIHVYQYHFYFSFLVEKMKLKWDWLEIKSPLGQVANRQKTKWDQNKDLHFLNL